MTKTNISDVVRLAVVDMLNEFATDVELGDYDGLTETIDYVAKTRTITMVRNGQQTTVVIPLKANA